MRSLAHLAAIVVPLALLAAGCGGGEASSPDPSPTGGAGAAGSASGGGAAGASGGAQGGASGAAGGGIHLPDRIEAVTQTVAKNSLCTKLTPFYWEIGDASGLRASGTGGDGSAAPPTADKVMAIASASKWIFSAWVLEKTSGKPTADQVDKLRFTSGYDNLDTASCLAGADTVNDCLQKGDNGTQTAGDATHFAYNGGHMQKLGQELGLGDDFINTPANAGKTPKLNADIAALLPPIQGKGLSFLYTNASLAGGVATSAAIYGQFLRAILAGELTLHDQLGTHAVCAWTNQPDCDALYSPVNQTKKGTTNDLGDEKWHYSLGHWVEDDPKVGDGAFSSPGAGGFYPWIDATKSWYGVLARFEAPTLSADPVAVDSVACGRAMRRAWVTGGAQTD